MKLCLRVRSLIRRMSQRPILCQQFDRALSGYVFNGPPSKRDTVGINDVIGIVIQSIPLARFGQLEAASARRAYRYPDGS